MMAGTRGSSRGWGEDGHLPSASQSNHFPNLLFRYAVAPTGVGLRAPRVRLDSARLDSARLDPWQNRSGVMNKPTSNKECLTSQIKNLVEEFVSSLD
jgi:hypothetical protein